MMLDDGAWPSVLVNDWERSEAMWQAVCSFHPMPWCTAQADAEDRPESGFALQHLK